VGVAVLRREVRQIEVQRPVDGVELQRPAKRCGRFLPVAEPSPGSSADDFGEHDSFQRTRALAQGQRFIRTAAGAQQDRHSRHSRGRGLAIAHDLDGPQPWPQVLAYLVVVQVP
jgi:hypothetical protein